MYIREYNFVPCLVGKKKEGKSWGKVVGKFGVGESSSFGKVADSLDTSLGESKQVDQQEKHISVVVLE